MITQPVQLRELKLGGDTLTVSEVGRFAASSRPASVGIRSEVASRMAASVEAVEQAVADGEPIYGVTTGFGGMVGVPVSAEQSAASQANLLTFLSAGAGAPIDRRHVRAAMLLRGNVLARGCSGARYEILDRLVTLLNAGATPLVRRLGSIGASGDLVPLSAIARAVTGTSGMVEVELGGRVVDGEEALREVGLHPLELLPKEGLALVNGTSFSSAVAANCVYDSSRLLCLALAIQGLMLRALDAHDGPFDPFVHAHKPHPGQVWVAQMVRRLVGEADTSSTERNGDRLQDRYSIRCLPQYLGSVFETLARVRRTVEIEMNAVSDNPLIDVETGCFHQSGNFLGQYLGVAMDDLRRTLGLTAKHLDVQIASLVAPEFSHGLPPSLRGNDELPYNMGLKGLQITGNSIMPMLVYYGNPVVEHYPTHAEQFNQNVNGLSWGAANLAFESVGLFRHYLSVATIFAVQALDLRSKQRLGHYDGRALLGEAAEPVYQAACEVLGVAPTDQRPFLYDDAEHWLEQRLEALSADLDGGGRLFESIEPILDSFDRTDC